MIKERREVYDQSVAVSVFREGDLIKIPVRGSPEILSPSVFEGITVLRGRIINYREDEMIKAARFLFSYNAHDTRMELWDYRIDRDSLSGMEYVDFTPENRAVLQITKVDIAADVWGRPIWTEEYHKRMHMLMNVGVKGRLLDWIDSPLITARDLLAGPENPLKL